MIKLRISIRGISPPIWRKLLVSPETALHNLHLMIQAAFGWYNYHLYEFSHQGLNFSRPDDWDEPASEDMDSTKITLGDLNLQRGTKFLYTYDFGDNWEHIILVQDILDYDPQMSVPACIGGKRNAPPEDCGGVWGYYNVLRIAEDPNDPEHNETVEWLGEYDPESFDIDSANRAVRNYREIDGTF
ncbi:MAG: plasmid pRiA4b ORF-3 family protein [Thermoplasmata archaeon]